MPTIRRATAADLPAIGRALTAAFHDDPLWGWLAPDRGRYERHAGAFFARDASLRIDDPGEVLVDEQIGGVAVWCPPGTWRTTTADTLRLAWPSLRLFGTGLTRSIRCVRDLERAHPREPHWYLSLLGTDPRHQGRGIGSALIRTVTDRCDDEGIAAYLESSKETNVSFYARHGFEVTGVSTMEGGPSLWLMWREPR